MSSSTLQQIFGNNAVQDANSITIAKADLTQNNWIQRSPKQPPTVVGCCLRN
jgi:hypothetical protein